jgi:hypothetical protein
VPVATNDHPTGFPASVWIRYLLDIKACAELWHLCRRTTTTPENPFRTRRGLTHGCAAVRLWQLLMSFHLWVPARRLGGWQMVASKGDLKCTPSVRYSSFKDVASLGLDGHGSFWPGSTAARRHDRQRPQVSASPPRAVCLYQAGNVFFGQCLLPGGASCRILTQ